MNQLTRSRVGLLLTCAVCCLAVFVASSYQEQDNGVDPEAYQAMMAAQVGDLQDLQDFYLAQREGYIAILPPGPEFILTQSGAPDVLPFDPKSFPSEFTDGLVPVYEDSVPVYPLTIAEDFTTRETYFLNADGDEIYALQAAEDYNPFAFLEERYPDLFPATFDSLLTDYLESLYDPARIRISLKLIATEDVEFYLYAQAQSAAAAAMQEQEGGGMMLLGMEDYSNHLWIAIQGPAAGLTNIEIAAHTPDGFTNRIEIFTCTNLIDFWWTLAATNLSTEGTNVVYWYYDISGVESTLFFAVGNADLDSDADELVDAREHFMYHTATNLWDTDGDGFAARYATNSTVAGYDLFNEPAPYTGSGWTTAQAFSNNIVPMLTRLHRAIRSNDTQHVLFMESNLMYTNMWAGDYLWWPAPAAQGWTNVAYEFHVYDRTVYGTTGSDEDSYFTTQKGICDTMIRAFTQLREQKNVPIYVGEYAPWNEQNFDYWTRQLQANDFHWGHWNYRSWGWDNSSKPEEGKTLWGLDYRSKDTTNQAPDLVTDDLETLVGKMALYNWDSYLDNEHLQDVVMNHTLYTNTSRERCSFFTHTFSAKNAESFSSVWPWNKLVGIGDADRFRIQGGLARLLINGNPVSMRLKSREEADARFEVNDSAGCWFSVSPVYFHVTNDLAGYDAAVNLCAVRDSVNKRVLDYDTKGVVARLEYDKGSSTVRVTVYAKSGGTNTYGTQLYQSGSIGFVPHTPFEMHVNSTNVLAQYNGTNVWSGTHTNLDLADWPDGAVCVVEADEPSAGRTWYVDLDDLRGEHANAQRDTLFDELFDLYPAGIELVAEPEYASMRDYWAPSRKTKSFVTNATCAWIPEEKAKGGSWYNARRHYHDDVRLAVTATNIVDLQVAWSDFAEGICKIAFMPEYFPAELYGEYEGSCLYAEIRYDAPPATTLYFQVVRQWGTDASRVTLGDTWGVTYVPGQVVSFQVSTNRCKLYYGSTNPIIDVAHGTNVLQVYPNGAFPHLEFQNEDYTTNAIITIQSVKAQRLSGFTAP